MNDEQHIPISTTPPDSEEPSAAPRPEDPVYADLPGGQGVRSGEEGEMPTVAQTGEYGRTSATVTHPAPPPVPDIPQPTAAEATGAEAEEGYDGQWEEVVASLTVLGDSIGRWARAAVRDPNYRRHADELKGALQNVAGKVTDAVDDAAQSEVAQGFREAAVKTGGTIYETGQRVYRDTVAPGLADAFRGAAEGLRFAAQKLEESRERAQEAAARAQAEAERASETPPPAEASAQAGAGSESTIEPPDPTEI